MGGIRAILGNGYVIQEQNCVARLQGRVLWTRPHYRNSTLVTWCFRWIAPDTFKWPNGQQSKLPFDGPWSLLGRGDFSILILWTRCQKAMRAEAEGLILFFGWLGVFHPSADGWQWHGAKSCLGPAEIWPNVFRGMQDEFRTSPFCR